MIFVDDFIGEDKTSFTKEWDGQNEINAYEKACEVMPADWYYRTAKITYKLNAHGHRCNEISDLDYNNYILFLGCSHTYAVGLELEHSFPFVVSQKLNVDYYNLSVSGTGIDVVEHNLLVWLHKIPKKPKAIIIQWPDSSRFLSADPNYKQLRPRGSWVSEKNTLDFLSYLEPTGVIHSRKKLIADVATLVTRNIPTLHFSYSSIEPMSNQCLSFRRIDYARDLAHSGIKSHQNFATSILQHLPPLK